MVDKRKNKDMVSLNPKARQRLEVALGRYYATKVFDTEGNERLRTKRDLVVDAQMSPNTIDAILNGTKPKRLRLVHALAGQLGEQVVPETDCDRPASQIDEGDSGNPDVGVYKRYEETDNALVEWAEDNEAYQAIILDYSNHKTSDLITRLFEVGVKEVTLYLQTLDGARRLGSTRQVSLIRREMLELYIEADEDIKSEKLKLRFYTVPPSVMGIRLDNKQGDSILCVGWFLWEPHLQESDGYSDAINEKIRTLPTPRQRNINDPLRLWSHILPRLIVPNDHPGFELLNQMFESQIKHFDLYHKINSGSEEFSEMDEDAIIAYDGYPSSKLLKVVGQQDDAYRELVSYIESHDVKKAIFIHFSAGRVEDLALALLKEKANITYYMYNPDSTSMQIPAYIRDAMNREKRDLETMDRHFPDKEGLRGLIDVRLYGQNPITPG